MGAGRGGAVFKLDYQENGIFVNDAGTQDPRASLTVTNLHCGLGKPASDLPL